MIEAVDTVAAYNAAAVLALDILGVLWKCCPEEFGDFLHAEER